MKKKATERARSSIYVNKNIVWNDKKTLGYITQLEFYSSFFYINKIEYILYKLTEKEK